MTSKLCYWFIGGVMKTPKIVETEKQYYSRKNIYKRGSASYKSRKEKKVTTANIILLTEEISGSVTESVLFQRQV